MTSLGKNVYSITIQVDLSSADNTIAPGTMLDSERRLVDTRRFYGNQTPRFADFRS